MSSPTPATAPGAPVTIRTYIDGTPEARAALERLCGRGESDFTRVEADVRAILDRRPARWGDAAVLAFAERFDKRRPSPLVRRDYQGAAALARLPAAARAALETAARRIRVFHERQRAHEAKTFSTHGRRRL